MSYYAFVDPSGGRHDRFTLAIAHVEQDRSVLDALRAWKPPFNPSGRAEERPVSTDPQQVQAQFGHFMHDPDTRLTCAACSRFQEATGQCEPREMTTRPEMPACSLFDNRRLEPV